MLSTPKSLRLQLGLFGRMNTGKSSFLNMITGQDVAITSDIPGTTTDVVEKSMELLPIGPVVFLDTAGIDDCSSLSGLRIDKSKKVFERADIVLLIIEPEIWGEYEESIFGEAKSRNIPCIIVVNKIDIKPVDQQFLNKVQIISDKVMCASSVIPKTRDVYLNDLKKLIINCCPDDFLRPPALIADLLPSNGLAVLIVPVDLEAPRGRIILPQVQTIRDLLDNNQGALVVKEGQYLDFLGKLNGPPDIVVCDSQVVLQMVRQTPVEFPCTTFSILFSRYKGDLKSMSESAAYIDCLVSGNKVLIAESCSHHPIADDIGRVKIPLWLKEYTKADLDVDVCSGRDWPKDIEQYSIIIQCGGCMVTRREILFRIQQANEKDIPLTNYGIAISVLNYSVERVLSPFPEALGAYIKKKLEVCNAGKNN